LAGETSDNDVGLASEEPALGNIFVDFDKRPVFLENPSCSFVDLTEADSLHAGSLKPKGHSADAGKEVQDIHLPSH
jgi:hypothetical protein